MMQRSIQNRRRVLMPLVVLVVAGMVAWWASQREIHRMDEIRTAVRNLCYDMTAGAVDTSAMRIEGSALRTRLALEIKAICPTPDAAMVLDVDVASGDISGIGRAQGIATHTAILRAGDIHLLGLRINHQGDEDTITVVGYWVPEVADATIRP